MISRTLLHTEPIFPRLRIPGLYFYTYSSCFCSSINFCKLRISCVNILKINFLLSIVLFHLRRRTTKLFFYSGLHTSYNSHHQSNGLHFTCALLTPSLTLIGTIWQFPISRFDVPHFQMVAIVATYADPIQCKNTCKIHIEERKEVDASFRDSQCNRMVKVENRWKTFLKNF